MLSSLLIKNFKRYEEAVIPLASMTFLTGPDAAGRSSALDALRLLSLLARGMRLDDIGRSIQNGEAGIRGYVSDLFSDASEELTIGSRLEEPGLAWNELCIKIGMQDGQLELIEEAVSSSSEALPLYRTEDLQPGHSDVLSVTYNDFKSGKNKPHVPCSNQQAVFCQLETPGSFSRKDAQAQKEIPAVTRLFREQLSNIVFLAPNPAAMRGYSHAGDDKLCEDGSNISGVLAKLCRQEQVKQSLLDFLCPLLGQPVTDISFVTTERNDVMLRLHESFGSTERTADAPLLSDGTLRILAVGALLLGAPEKAMAVIEEADSGVYPGRAAFWVQQIQGIATSRGLQVLFSTHNPALLDAVSDTAPDTAGNVLYCCRNPENGNSRIVRLADMKRFPELMARGPLGRLMESGWLEKFLQDTATEEERMLAALSWLEQLRREAEA